MTMKRFKYRDELRIYNQANDYFLLYNDAQLTSAG